MYSNCGAFVQTVTCKVATHMHMYGMMTSHYAANRMCTSMASSS